MEDRSAGIIKRKEDEIEEDNNQWMFYQWMFCGVVNSIEDLPQNTQQGRIYVIEDTKSTCNIQE